MILQSSWGWVWEIPFIFFLFLKGEFVFSLFPCIAKSSMTGKPVVWLWEPRSNTVEDEKRDAEITALVGGQRVNSWLRTALRSASFLQSEAPWSKLAALLPVNSGFCLQKKCHFWKMGQASDVEQTGREQQQPFQEHVGETAKDSISAAWLALWALSPWRGNQSLSKIRSTSA